MGTERDSFQKAGEVCEACKERWENQGLPGKTLIALPNVTQIYHQEVAVCSYCDGEPIVIFANLNRQNDE